MRFVDDVKSIFVPPEVRFGATPVKVIGAQAKPLRDAYHAVLRLSWSTTIVFLAATFVAVNALFAVAYMVVGGVANARPGSFVDAFFFSVQTLGTIGYGHLEPESIGAHLLVLAESFVSLFMTAVATGIVFSRFSQPRARLQFSSTAVIGPMDGVPTLMMRVGNERASAIVEALVRVSLIRTERTAEGKTFYRIYDLKLARERSSALMRSWTILHAVDESSPLFKATPETVAAACWRRLSSPSSSGVTRWSPAPESDSSRPDRFAMHPDGARPNDRSSAL